MWEKPADAQLGGGGLTRIIENGNLLERGGVGFSHVVGKALPPSASAQRPELAGRRFEALGVSLVFHPRNPHVPTVHMNVRFFIAKAKDQPDIFWFGGGTDLTPYYGYEEDAQHFHATCKRALEPFGADKYPRFKKWCDEYFYLKHRDEPRGIGGVFFDDFHEPGFAQSFAMQRAVGDAFLDAYVPIVERRRDVPYGEREREFQAYRRGPLRRIQSRIRSRHIVRPAVRRAHRIDPDVAATDRALEIRLAPGARNARSTVVFGLSASARMGIANGRTAAPIGLLGGSFDPIHHGHLQLARDALKHLPLEEVRFIPAAQPWQKGPMTAAEHRAQMVQLAIADEPALRARHA